MTALIVIPGFFVICAIFTNQWILAADRASGISAEPQTGWQADMGGDSK